MSPRRLRLRRKCFENKLNPLAPPVARKRAADARQRIQESIKLLRNVHDIFDLEKVEDLKNLTVSGFLRWIHLGNDTLYKTNEDLLHSVRSELERVRKLHRSTSAGCRNLSRKENKTKQMKSKINELEVLLAARNMDCLSLIKEIESVRRTNRELKTRLKRTTQSL